MNWKKIRFLKRTASLQNTIQFGLLFSVMAFFIMPCAVSDIKLHSPATGPLDNLFFYSPERAFAMMAAYGERGRELYLVVELTAGMVYPVLLAVFLTSLLIWSAPGGRNGLRQVRIMILLPFAGMLLNWLENIGIILMLSLYPEQWKVLALITAFFTAGKWTVMAGCLLLAGRNLLQLARARLTGWTQGRR